ncbi:hypothetical protein [Microbacterium sp. MYb66]|jgi:hypothetical protein|uniref:hypothetical protein n=1 Tax=Microbacterium sp. MYb66 TaxID=1848692 RepID=UPI000CFF6DD8|nr:hypothetical protein [Microbacterium sp. MYb66]PRA80625.1 hypothetical protein CQ045_10150 [Microbacterium sp. MYb66]
MVDSPQPAPLSIRLAQRIGLALLAAGALTLILSIGFDLDGFGGGLIQGAAVGGMLVGTYFWGFGNGFRRRDRPQWLPSRGTIE